MRHFVCANPIALGAAPSLVSVTGADMNGVRLTETLADWVSRPGA